MLHFVLFYFFFNFYFQNLNIYNYNLVPDDLFFYLNFVYLFISFLCLFISAVTSVPINLFVFTLRPWVSSHYFFRTNFPIVAYVLYDNYFRTIIKDLISLLYPPLIICMYELVYLTIFWWNIQNKSTNTSVSILQNSLLCSYFSAFLLLCLKVD